MAEKLDYKKLSGIKEWLQVVEGINLYDLVKGVEICLVLDIIIPIKFKCLILSSIQAHGVSCYTYRYIIGKCLK
jgi:hypothetical protein